MIVKLGIRATARDKVRKALYEKDFGAAKSLGVNTVTQTFGRHDLKLPGVGEGGASVRDSKERARGYSVINARSSQEMSFLKMDCIWHF